MRQREAKTLKMRMRTTYNIFYVVRKSVKVVLLLRKHVWDRARAMCTSREHVRERAGRCSVCVMKPLRNIKGKNIIHLS